MLTNRILGHWNWFYSCMTKSKVGRPHHTVRSVGNRQLPGFGPTDYTGGLGGVVPGFGGNSSAVELESAEMKPSYTSNEMRQEHRVSTGLTAEQS